MLNDDLGSIAAGTAGGVVRWCRSPDGRTGLLVALLSGGGCGYLGNALVKWNRPEIPADVRIGTAFLIGVVSAIIIDLAITLARRARDRATAMVDLKYPPSPPGIASDGRNDSASDTPKPPATK